MQPAFLINWFRSMAKNHKIFEFCNGSSPINLFDKAPNLFIFISNSHIISKRHGSLNKQQTINEAVK